MSFITVYYIEFPNRIHGFPGEIHDFCPLSSIHLFVYHACMNNALSGPGQAAISDMNARTWMRIHWIWDWTGVGTPPKDLFVDEKPCMGSANIIYYIYIHIFT